MRIAVFSCLFLSHFAYVAESAYGGSRVSEEDYKKNYRSIVSVQISVKNGEETVQFPLYTGVLIMFNNVQYILTTAYSAVDKDLEMNYNKFTYDCDTNLPAFMEMAKDNTFINVIGTASVSIGSSSQSACYTMTTKSIEWERRIKLHFGAFENIRSGHPLYHTLLAAINFPAGYCVINPEFLKVERNSLMPKVGEMCRVASMVSDGERIRSLRHTLTTVEMAVFASEECAQQFGKDTPIVSDALVSHYVFCLGVNADSTGFLSDFDLGAPVFCPFGNEFKFSGIIGKTSAKSTLIVSLVTTTDSIFKFLGNLHGH